MNEQAEFADHIEMQKYAERNGLDYAWSGTAVFAKRERTLPPDQLEVRAVLAMRASWSGYSRRPSPGQSGRLTRSGGHGGETAGRESTGRVAAGAFMGPPKIGSRNGCHRLPYVSAVGNDLP
jgi:hypothetical protein